MSIFGWLKKRFQKGWWYWPDEKLKRELDGGLFCQGLTCGRSG